MFSKTLGLYLPDTKNIFLVVTMKMSPDIDKYSLGWQHQPGWEPTSHLEAPPSSSNQARRKHQWKVSSWHFPRMRRGYSVWYVQPMSHQDLRRAVGMDVGFSQNLGIGNKNWELVLVLFDGFWDSVSVDLWCLPEETQSNKIQPSCWFSKKSYSSFQEKIQKEKGVLAIQPQRDSTVTGSNNSET